MLLAELHKKVRPFACSHCGEEIDPEDSTAIEDALTSHVFGALRHLPPELGILPVVKSVAPVEVEPRQDADIQFWPFGTVQVVGLGAAKSASMGVEPDVAVSLPSAVLCVEVKLGSKLGADPLQLPKEVLWTLQNNDSRPWWLICVTTDRVEPVLRSFTVADEMLVLGESAPIAAAVSSYFSCAKTLLPDGAWPDPSEVESRVKWLSWRRVGALLADIAESASIDPHHRRQLADVVRLLRMKGLASTPFHGFTLGHRTVPQFKGVFAPSSKQALWARIRVPLLPDSVSWLTRPAEDHRLWRIESRTLPEGIPAVWRQQGQTHGE